MRYYVKLNFLTEAYFFSINIFIGIFNKISKRMIDFIVCLIEIEK